MTGSTMPAYLHYTLRLRAPAIVSTLAGPPGSALTQPFIPGSVIRGAMAARLLAAGVADTDEIFRALVLSGEVRYLHAYPEAAGARALPVPASWRSEKSDETTGHDLAAYSGEILPEHDLADLAEIWPTESLASVPAPFVAAVGSARQLVRPRIDARLHQQRDREKGRPWKVEGREGYEEAHGTLFSSEYLNAEQVFRGVVQVTAGAGSALFARVRELLSREQPILIGRSRRAGYGGEADITSIQDAPQEYNQALGRLLKKDVHAGTCFCLMTVSAYIGRHHWTGQMDPTALEHEIRERLGRDSVEVVRRCWSFETLGGFNRRWRTEVPQTLAAAAGAVLVLKANKRIPQEAVRQIEHDGVGERRVEGFGRVLFLEYPDEDGTIYLEHHKRHGPDANTAGRSLSASAAKHEAKELAFLERRIVLAAAWTELDRVAADIARKAEKIPTSSLLGRIRTLFRGVHDKRTAEQALDELVTWCSNSDDDPGALARRARDQLDVCRIGRDNLREWLRMIADPAQGQSRWKAVIAASGHADTITGLAHKHHLTSQSAAERVLQDSAAQLGIHLIDTTLAALARKKRRANHE